MKTPRRNWVGVSSGIISSLLLFSQIVGATTIVSGDLSIRDGGDLVFTDGSVQKTAQVKGPTGSQGPTGPAGAVGPSNVLTIGAVLSGVTPAANLTGVSPQQILNLTLPQGAVGPQGPQGPGGGAYTWISVTGNVTASPNTGYVAADNVNQTAVILPLAPKLGDTVKVSGYGSKGWVVSLPVNGQWQGLPATTGTVAGTYTDAIEFTCIENITAPKYKVTGFTTTSSIGFTYNNGVVVPPSTIVGGSIKGTLALANVVGTLAGQAANAGSDNGVGVLASFSYPSGVTTDGTNLFVTDTYNNTIRKINIVSGTVTTIVGAPDKTGGVDGAGATATMNMPVGVTTDGTNLYVTDSGNNTIRKIVIATNQVSTIAGTALAVGANDGTGAAAQFNYPSGITILGTNLYVVDSYNLTIRKIEMATGKVTTIAGKVNTPGSDDGTGTAALFYYPTDITTDGTNLYVADTYSNTIRKIEVATAKVTTFAGAVDVPGAVDGVGILAQFNYPSGISCDGANLYVADTGNNTIRKIEIATAKVSTIAGSKSGANGVTDGNGTSALFYNPLGLTSNGSKLFVVDSYNSTIRVIQ